MQIHFASETHTHSLCDCRSNIRETIFFHIVFRTSFILFSSANLTQNIHTMVPCKFRIRFGSLRLSFLFWHENHGLYFASSLFFLWSLSSWKFQFPIIWCDNFDMAVIIWCYCTTQSNCIKSSRKIYINIECKKPALLSQCLQNLNVSVSCKQRKRFVLLQ